MVRVQAIYTGAVASQGAQDPSRPDLSGFSLGHAEMILEGHVGGPFFQYRLQVDAAESPSLKDAYVAWHPIRMLSIWAGQFKVPYGLQRQYWKAELEFVEHLGAHGRVLAGARPRPDAHRPAGPWAPDRAGRRSSTAPAPTSPTTTSIWRTPLRIVATPFGPLPQSEGDIEGHVRPLLSVGAAGYYNLAPTDVVARCDIPNACPSIPMPLADSDGDGRVDNVAVWQGGLELRALWRGAALQARAASAGSRIRARRAPRAATGAPTSRRATSCCLTACRWRRAWGTPICRSTARPPNSACWPAAPRTSRAPGLHAYLRGHRVKVQVDYSHLTSDGQTAPSANRIQAAVQVGF